MGNTSSTRKHRSTDKDNNSFSKYVRSSTFKRHNKFKTRRHNYKKHHHKKRYHGGVYGSSLKNVVNANSEGEALSESEPRKTRKLPVKRSIMDRGKVKNPTIHSLKEPTIEGRLDREEAEKRARLSREADASPGPRKRSPGKSADAEVAAIRKAKSEAAKLLEERKSHTLSRQRERDRLLLFGGPKTNPLFKSRSGSVSKLEPMILEEEE